VGATGTDVAALAQAVQADVLARFGVSLQPEPIYLGMA
jgi:UDP-N-acetylmuramate dehydrogenase